MKSKLSSSFIDAMAFYTRLEVILLDLLNVWCDISSQQLHCYSRYYSIIRKLYKGSSHLQTPIYNSTCTLKVIAILGRRGVY